MLNKHFLLGRLTRDPEVRYSNGENPTAIARFSLAVDRRYIREGEPTADFFNCTAFGRQAEFAEKYLKKGSKIIIVARAESDNYTDKNGNNVYGFRWIIEEIEFADAKKQEEQFMEIPEDEELPFAPEKPAKKTAAEGKPYAKPQRSYTRR